MTQRDKKATQEEPQQPVVAVLEEDTTQGKRRIARGTAVRVTSESFAEAQRSDPPRMRKATAEDEVQDAEIVSLLPPGYGEPPVMPAPASPPAGDNK